MMSVSRGAAICGLSRRTNKGLISAGYARNIFIELAGPSGDMHYALILKKGAVYGEENLVKKLGKGSS